MGKVSFWEVLWILVQRSMEEAGDAGWDIPHLGVMLLLCPYLWTDREFFEGKRQKYCEVMIQNNGKDPLLLHRNFALNVQLVWQQAWQHRLWFFPDQLVNCSTR